MVSARKQTASAECPLCCTTFDRLPVEDGAVTLEVTPCRDCGAPLCACCSQFACDGCGHAFCTSHMISVPDGTERPLKCCATCAAECEACELPAPFPPANETRRVAYAAEVA